MDRLFADMFGEMGMAMRPIMGDGGEGGTPTYHLPVNIMETDSGYMIEAPVPGFKPEDVDITFSDGMLTINARRSEAKRQGEGNWLRRELGYGHYMRQITLPGQVKADDIKASFDDGMLMVEVPRAPKPKAAHIEVQRGKQMAGSGSGKRS
jgi:HSP20 family protein